MVAAEFTVTKDLSLDPWLLGYLIGDANLRNHSTRFSSMDEWLVEATSAVLPEGCHLSDNVETRVGYSPSFNVQGLGPGRKHPLTEELRELGLAGVLSGEKFVPDAYKWASAKDRLAILQGLMDADGSIDKTTSARLDFTSCSERLALDVQHLIRSLGGRSNIYSTFSKCQRDGCTGHAAFKQRPVLPDNVNPFRLPRKAVLRRPKSQFTGWRVTSIEPAGTAEVSCIKVASPSGLFITDDFVVTHNTGNPEGCHVPIRRNRYYVMGVVDTYAAGFLVAEAPAPQPPDVKPDPPVPTPIPTPPEDDDMPGPNEEANEAGDFVDGLYERYLGKKPDPTTGKHPDPVGRHFWLNELGTGSTQANVELRFFTEAQKRNFQ